MKSGFSKTPKTNKSVIYERKNLCIILIIIV